MTTDELDLIAKRAEAATRGPWEWTWNDIVDVGYELLGALQDGALEAHGARGYVLHAIEAIARDGSTDTEPSVMIDPADRDFIAASRSDIPNLLAEVRRLQAVIDDVTAIACRRHMYGEDVRGLILRRLTDTQSRPA